MGKYIDHLNHLREQRLSDERHYQSIISNYGSMMDDKYRRLNEQHHTLRMKALDREICEAERKA